MYKNLKGGYREYASRLLVASSDRPRVNSYKLEHGRLCLNIRKHFFTLQLAEHWHRLPGEVVESPSLEILKSSLDMAWIDFPWCLCKGIGQSRNSFQLSRSVILTSDNECSESLMLVLGNSWNTGKILDNRRKFML